MTNPQAILDNWDEYINEYEEGLASLYSQLNPSNQDQVQQYAKQAIHLTALKRKREYLQNYYIQQGILPQDITFENINGGVAFYKHSQSDINLIPVILTPGIQGQVFAESEDFQLTITIDNATYQNSCEPASNGINTIGFKYTGPSNYYIWFTWKDTKGYLSNDARQHVRWTNELYGYSGSTSTIPVIPRGQSAYLTYFGGGSVITLNENVTSTDQPWSYYDNILMPSISPSNRVFPGGYSPISSPLSLSLWSIKETKDDIKVANVFPYNHDAGEGTFFAQVRSKIKYDTLTRDENSEVIINGLRFEFEDAVRKSSWRDEAEEPEPYLLATYNFDQINSANFNSGENVIPKGEIQVEDFPSELEDMIIKLKDNKLVQGSYLGEVVSYFDATDTKYDVWIDINWKNRPIDYQGTGRLVIYDNNGTEEASHTDSGPIAGYKVSLQKYDNEGKPITHTIKYQMYTHEDNIDNNWSVYVNNYKINYEDGIKTVGITNTYNKTIYYYDHDDHVLPVSKIFNDLDFINPSAFISYMKKLQVEAGKNPVKDWETYLKNQGAINNIKQNQVAFFLAKFTYNNEKFGGECFTIIPYLTIVIKENNDTSINTFEIIAKPPEQGDNPLANDMNENLQWSDENLIWPYYSKRNCDSQGNDQLGTASTKLFTRKGCYIEGGIGHEWNYANDDYVLRNYWETEVNITTPYIGEPFGNNQTYYKIINNNSINTVLTISQDFIPKLSNFCIFIIDNNMADAQDVLSIVPYYYKVEIIEPIDPTSQNKLGTMFATLVFNPKEENYWDANPAPYKDIDIQNYKAHMVYETPGKFVIQGEDSMVYLVSQSTVRDGMVGKEGEEEEFPGVQDVKDWINPNNKKEIFIT